MNVSNGVGPAKADSANEKLRPAAHGQFKLLPVPLRDDLDWNSRIANWACAA